MKEAFAAGILVIFTSVFAELLKNLLEKAVPAWSLQLCVYIASGSVCASAFLVGFAVLGTALTTGALDHGISCRPSVRQTRSLRKYRG